MHYRLLHDSFLRYYRIHTPDDGELPKSLEPEQFWTIADAERVIRQLNAPAYYWHDLLARYASTLDEPDSTPTQRISRLLTLGWLKLYRVNHLDEHTTTPDEHESFPTRPTGTGARWELVPASVLLTRDNRAERKTFRTLQDAETYLKSLQLDTAELQALLSHSGTDIDKTPDAKDGMTKLAQALVAGQIIVLTHREGTQPPEQDGKLETAPAQGPGYRPATLGPPANSSSQNNNKDENTSSTKTNEFTNLKEMNSQYKGEETGAVWGTKVEYLDEQERQQYKLKIKDGKVYDNNDELFDTADASSVFGGGEGNAIFVMDEYGNIYASKHQAVGKFHHSSFLSGGPVAAAGEISAQHGKITKITRRSGHYQPGEEHMQQLTTKLQGSGIDLANIDIQAGF